MHKYRFNYKVGEYEVTNEYGKFVASFKEEVHAYVWTSLMNNQAHVVNDEPPRRKSEVTSDDARRGQSRDHLLTKQEVKLKRIEKWASTPVYENDSVLFCTKDASAGYEMAQELVNKILRGDE